MRRSFILFVGLAAACGSKEPPRAESAPTPPASSAAPDDANRALDQNECEALAKWLVDACDNRGNSHSQQIDRWCGDLTRKVNDGRFVAEDCLPHIKHIDATCFHSSTSVRNLMDCESTVTKPQSSP